MATNQLRWQVIALSVLLVGAAFTRPSTGAARASGAESAWITTGRQREAANTHLWIVNRSVEIFAVHDASGALWMSLFRGAWQAGLYDADHRAPFCDKGWYLVYYGCLFTSHFYDPATGRNWRDQTVPTARTAGVAHFLTGQRLWRAGNLEAAIYHLGLSLHFLTDLTQPMHAANFTYLDSGPFGYHTAAETFAATVQAQFALGGPVGYYHWAGDDPGEWFTLAAHTAKQVQPQIWNPTIRGYWERGQTARWQAAAKPYLGQQLQEAQRITAGFIDLWFRTL